MIVGKVFDGNDRIKVFYLGRPDIKITPTMTMAGTSGSTATQLVYPMYSRGHMYM